jgi:hypothetical protein
MPFIDVNFVAGISSPPLVIYNGSLAERQALQWPKLSYSSAPVLTFTANGQTTLDLPYSNSALPTANYAWSTTNADYVKIESTTLTDPATFNANMSADDQRICQITANGVLVDAFNTRGWPTPLNGSAIGTYRGCDGYIYKTTITAGQVFTGKETKVTVTVKVHH